MNTVGMIEVTGVDLAHLVRAAYSPSRPQGLGYIHYQPGDLDDETVRRIIEGAHDHVAVRMDYVNGRSCKFSVFREGERLFIHNSWYDHSDAALAKLLESVGLSADLIKKARTEKTEHDEACAKAAVTFLTELGGQYKQNSWRDEDKLDANVRDGLFIAKCKSLVDEEYKGNGVTVWTLKKSA